MATVQRVRTTVMRDYFVPGKSVHFAALRAYHGPDERPPNRVQRLLRRSVAANTRAYDAVLGFPERLEDNWLLLRDPQQRRLLRRALKDDRLLTEERRKAITSILLWTVVLAWAVAGSVIALVSDDALALYRAGYSLFFYALATSLFLPTPFEVILAGSAHTLGLWWTVAIAAVAKTAGSWVVLLAGDKANKGLNEALGDKGLLARILRGVERFAQRYGYGFIFVILAIPFMADTVPLFIAAMLRMRKAPFLAVTFAAIVVRSLLFLAAPGLLASLSA